MSSDCWTAFHLLAGTDMAAVNHIPRRALPFAQPDIFAEHLAPVQHPDELFGGVDADVAPLRTVGRATDRPVLVAGELLPAAGLQQHPEDVVGV